MMYYTILTLHQCTIIPLVVTWMKREGSLTIVSRSTSSYWPLELVYWDWFIGKRVGDAASLRPNSWPIRKGLLTDSWFN